MHAPTPPRPATKSRKAFWLKQLHMWHWMSSAISLIGLLLFAITGFTLNHAADIEGSPVVAEKAAQMPPALLTRLKSATPAAEKAPLPADVARWVEDSFPVKASGEAEWSAGEVYLPAPRPGGDAWVAIDLATGEASSEVTSRGWISYLNDLHKGRNSGTEWSLFIDIFAFACLIFAITGLVLLWLHSAKRKSTWPLVGMGLAFPAAIAVIFIH
ncbi:PepSY-associated TM helix domain-containing protein [Sphingopyxis fribergensis]|uniref:PepSY-associated TM helix domain-containing protein n=1 Tax=Sphingopyxis fribergensis TaxID=1515612 RepID=A0A0A7PF20_9SPHN|nr:PepSY-associated TM helix domain-containing protein [Sphingopyxis fribergensis]AJA08574.1 PepSY-associated TM helix domain-containing protein [Sphingopyxis fribergensis]